MGELLFLTGCGFAAFALVWLLWGLACHLLGKPQQDSLWRAVMARTVAPSWVVAVLVMTGLATFHYSEERRWIQQDRLLESSSDPLGEGSHEWRTSRQIRSELMDKLAELPRNR